MFFQNPQPQFLYKDQLNAIRLIRKDAQGEKFSIQAYPIPYWSQQGWEYLFWYDGSGDINTMPVSGADKLFVITQPDIGNPKFQQKWLKETVSAWGKEFNKHKVGNLNVREIETNEK